MESSNTLSKISYKDIFHEFIDTTTINGLSRVTSPSRIRGIIWGVMVATVFICFSVHFYFMLGNYLVYPTNTQVVIEEGAFQFPDVTICTLHPFSEDKVDEERLGIDNATKFWYNVLPSSIEKDIRYSQAEGMAHLSFRKYAHDRDIYIDLLDHVHLCLFKGGRCNPNDFSISRLPESRNCFTYHPTERIYNEINSGMDRAFVLILDTGKAFNSKPKILNLLSYRGMNIVIHENGTRPNFNEKILVQQGKLNKITLTMSKYSSISTPKKHCRASEVERPWAWKVSQDNVKRADLIFYQPNRDSCRERKIQEYFSRECQCWHDKHLIPLSAVNDKSKNYPLCHELPREYFYNQEVKNGTLFANSNKYELDVKTNLDYRKIIERYKCFQAAKRSLVSYLKNVSTTEECEHLCGRIDYSSVLSVSECSINAKIYRELYEDVIKTLRVKNRNKNMSELDIDQSMIFLMISPIELDVSDTVESLAYPFSAFMSDFGGNIGLWIGCTVITVAELLELIIRLSYLKIKRSVIGKSTIKDNIIETPDKEIQNDI